MSLFLQDLLEKIADTQADEMIDPRTCELRFELAHDTISWDLLDHIVETTYTQRSRLTGGPLLLIVVGDSDTIDEQEREDAERPRTRKPARRSRPNAQRTVTD